MLDSAAHPSGLTSETTQPTPMRFVVVTLDSHLAGALERLRPTLTQEIPGLELSLHAAAEWAQDPEALAAAERDIAQADIVLATMLFLDDQLKAILPALTARREACDAMLGCVAAGEVIKLTKLGRLRMDGPQTGPIALLKRLRGAKSDAKGGSSSSGSAQMAMLRRLPKILRYIPGKAQDLRAYFLTMQYWLSGSDENIANMVRFLIDRYADGPRRHLRGQLTVAPPANYPDVGLYHPRAADRVTDQLDRLPHPPCAQTGLVGLLLMRSYVLANDTAHYDGVIAALEARGLRVVPAFAAGLDSRPAIEQFYLAGAEGERRATVDAVVSLTGFSLVGGPAYNDAQAAEETLAALDVPYIAAHALEFQSLEAWRSGDRGLTPIEATMMVAIPEIDGAAGPIVFGGRAEGREAHCEGCDRRCAFDDDTLDAGARRMRGCPERAETLAARVAKLVALRRSDVKDRKIAITLFNFPPNAGATGTAAYLSVFQSLYNTLTAMAAAGYRVDVPESVDDLKTRILEGSDAAAASRWGADAAVAARVAVDDYVRAEPHLADIEAQWGPAPGRQQTDGRSIFILGAAFGNVFVGVQPAFGYEGDPMRLLFEKGFAPTHAFSAYYRWLRDEFGAHAVLHFGTHGALEFMPGKQTGLDSACWPDRLIGDLPNINLYAANNPSEGALAKRRAAATLVSHLTPPIAQAGLYRGLIDLKASLERWRAAPPEAADERTRLVDLIDAQASELDLAPAGVDETSPPERRMEALAEALHDLEYALIPHGLHIVGATASTEARAEMLLAAAGLETVDGDTLGAFAALAEGASPEQAASDPDLLEALTRLEPTARALSQDHEIPALLRALEGRFIRPSPGGDLLRTPETLPTGRNIHGFDPFRLPSAFALDDGARQAERLLARHQADGGELPRTVAMVLWGTDTLKTEGAPIGQALALLGARPRLDSYGRVCGAELIDLETLGRPRIDVVLTLSGIFRDLLPLQTTLLAEAAYLAAAADEPLEQNHVRAHTLAYAERCGCDFETAALRVFSNADGAYGSNVNQLVDSGAWGDEDELADAYAKRKCYAYGRNGAPQRRPEILETALADVDLAYQNLDSVELGVTTIDHYFDTLGGVSRAVRRAKRQQRHETAEAPVYIGDQTRGAGKVRTLAEQVALETRTRTLNPKWYEGMLEHGYEGVRQIEAHVTNTLGWSATTGQVDPWVYQRITQTFLLDDEMRQRLAELNPKASAKVANRLLEAHERDYWRPDPETLAALRAAGDELEDRLEGVSEAAA